MRKLIVFTALAALMLTGCGAADIQSEPAARVAIKDVLPEKPAPADGTVMKTFNNIMLTVPKAWREQALDHDETVFIDDETHCAYMYCGCTGDRWLSQETILKDYLGRIGRDAEMIMELTRTKKSSAGISYKLAAIKYSGDSTSNVVMFIFAPENRMFWILKGETVDELHTQDVLETLTGLAETAEFLIPNSSKDVITGNTVKAQGAEKYTIKFGKKGTYDLVYDLPYEDGEHKTGSYKLYRGQKAIDFLVENYPKQFKEDDLNTRIKNTCQSFNDFYAVELEVGEEWARDGLSHTASYKKLFTGTFGLNGKLKMFDHFAGYSTTWVPKEK